MSALVELIEAATKFLHASFPPEFEGCPEEVQREYRYRHKQLIAALARCQPDHLPSDMGTPKPIGEES